LGQKIINATRCAIALVFSISTNWVFAQEALEEIRIIGTTPGSSPGQDINKVPFAVQKATYADLEGNQSFDISDFMNNKLGSVSINSAQNNPLQPDVQFRGFTASPLLGLPQGLAVYQNGVRINEPLGDSVNWDLLPESAVYSIDLISGANPVFGLNTLGGALSVDMKNGFNFTGHQVEGSGGSWGRLVGNVESGANNGVWGYYLNLGRFAEDGWRPLSVTEATNFYGSLSWRNADRSALDLIYQQGDSSLRGNGSLPIGLLARERDAIFTAPDITENDLRMINIDASHFINDSIQISGNAFWRENVTDAFNGDGSDFESCLFSGGAQALLEEADDAEAAMDELLGIALDDLCAGNDPTITNFGELEDFITQAALTATLDPETFELEDIIDELRGAGVITDEAINNISKREQTSRGLNGQLAFQEDLFRFGNQLILGFGFFAGESDFNSVVELADLDPVSRSTEGLGVGTFIDSETTDIHTETETLSWFFTDTIDLTKRLTLTLSGRYNDTDISLRDRSGVRPELNGDHSYARFNPAVGLTFNANADTNLYGSYSESSRVPTPIELSCNEGVFQLARQFAIAEGEDPNDIELECRLPNAFLADPPLLDVVTRSFELGVRGDFKGLNYQAGFFHATNEDDIIFQTTGRATGLFANVEETRRWGLETSVNGTVGKLDWYVTYSFIEATFEDDFHVQSPNHPNADAVGKLAVQSGDRLPGIPENIFKIGGNYHVNDDLSIGADAMYNSDQVIRGDESNDLDTIDGYTLVNLRASYAVSEKFTVFASVTNVLDEEYENFGLLGEDPSEIVPGLADNRPIFLGVGAPRAAWVGLRFKF